MENKRNKHILVNLTEDQYNALLLMATKNRRKLADMAFILLSDAIDDNIAAYTTIKSGEYKKMHFIPVAEDIDR